MPSPMTSFVGWCPSRRRPRSAHIQACLSFSSTPLAMWRARRSAFGYKAAAAWFGSLRRWYSRRAATRGMRSPPLCSQPCRHHRLLLRRRRHRRHSLWRRRFLRHPQPPSILMWVYLACRSQLSSRRMASSYLQALFSPLLAPSCAAPWRQATPHPLAPTSASPSSSSPSLRMSRENASLLSFTPDALPTSSRKPSCSKAAPLKVACCSLCF